MGSRSSQMPTTVPSTPGAAEMLPLSQLEPTLSSDSYYDRGVYEHELERIWYQDWICVGRSAGLEKPGMFRTLRLAEQELLVVRDEDGVLRAFHNTCRHRGSVLCEQAAGAFGKGRIVCPYHAWTYSLCGELIRTPWRLASADFFASEFSLYGVGVGEWGGKLFVNLSASPSMSLLDRLAEIPGLFENWQLESAVSGYRYVKEVRCNWKIFWENFSECYHCPGIHPELCKVVPRYGNGIVRATDDPAWDPEDESVRSSAAGLASGMVTWSDDGQTELPFFAGLSEEQRSIGQVFGTLMPSCFIAAHVDFVRFGHIKPLGPERTAVVVECLFPAETVDRGCDLTGPSGFVERLTDQDMRVCELNQRGLHCRRHKQGVLVPQEYYTHRFHQWVRERTA